jgi:4-hydroxybenzoyl-CoA thioesterase
MTFHTSRPLRFGDCDPSGIAYFPSYLNILVGVVEDFFTSIGADWKHLNGERQIATPTVRLDLTFVKPGFHADQLEFTLSVIAVGRSSLDLEHMVHSNGALLWSAKHRLVATSAETHKACAWPDDIRAALKNHLETPHA